LTRIDSHQHFWKYSPDEYSWIPVTNDSDGFSRERRLDRDFLPSDLRPILDEARLDGCIAVQARQALEENDFLLQLSDMHDFVLGVVGWIDLRSTTCLDQAKAFAAHPKAVGVRHVVQDEVAPDFMAQSAFRAGISTLRDLQLVYDILIFEHQLDDAIELVKAFPSQRFVLDHIAKPRIRDGWRVDWKERMAMLARLPNVYVKLSGMVTEADHLSWTPERLTPYWEAIIELFSPQRVMYGSDWPVIRLAGTYQRWFSIVETWISRLNPLEQKCIMGETAREAYFTPF
jgi:L-fuconolactonase